MNVIFLDIDGVLNSGNYIVHLDGAFDNPENQMDPEAVARLNRLTDLTKAQIVVTSTWRLFFKNSFEQLQGCLVSYKITGEVIAATGVGKDRREEIEEFLNTNDVKRFVIFDDDVIDGFPSEFIKTNFEHGLQDEHVEKALRIFQMNDEYPFKKVFVYTGKDFSACNAAEAWAKSVGLSYGSLEMARPRGLMFSNKLRLNEYIPKWKHIGSDEEYLMRLDGLMTSADFRNGDVTIELRKEI